ncbi:MAG: ParA family protein [Ignavibacteria bacterium]|nr:ParA family protein [Ignavibacteria bacterium]MBT8381585.1 ParA family protein [Ignavibacteria bacterium]MBT8391976.1 ParA family protein [Ignavibacteria bacterium]NNJ53164.1 ParA family protein [Ignavibacteriaceae bacterium]NNL21037.1 ParA family protein [Ignavibacteriaceae bacterium]
MGKIIAVAIPKGGVGKTTTAVNLAIAFALSGKRTLLIDVDPAGSCAEILGYKKEEITSDIFNVLQFNSSFQQVLLKSPAANLNFIPMKHLTYIDEIRLGRLSTNEKLLSNILKPEAYSYDYVVIDCPPYLIGTTNAALIAADTVLIPTMPGQLSINAVNKIVNHVKDIQKKYNSRLRIEGILLTIYEYNTRVSFATKKNLFRKYPNLIFNTTIPKNATVGEASVNNKPVLIFDPAAKASLAYINLAQEIIQKRDLINLENQF